jgi:8-oxo-dGTP pyrophosphatase MutT (NUDIX family)
MAGMIFDDDLRLSIVARLAAFPRQDGGPGLGAAVAVVVTDEGTGADVPGLPPGTGHEPRAALLLTRRAAHLRRHAGQWALPGGRIDPGESPEEAALRELFEEVGLCVPDSAILGRLDAYPTRSGFTMTPVVVWGGAQPALQINPHEVASVHRIPLTEFLRGDAPLLEDGPEAGRPVLRMPIGETWIAAPTAAILLQFREVCLRGAQTRVAHYDQPDFAWR